LYNPYPVPLSEPGDLPVLGGPTVRWWILPFATLACYVGFIVPRLSFPEKIGPLIIPIAKAAAFVPPSVRGKLFTWKERNRDDENI